jgi:hypothetical protein
MSFTRKPLLSLVQFTCDNFELYCHLGRKAMWFGGSPMFRKNMSPLPSVSNSKLSKKPAEGRTLSLLLLVSCLSYASTLKLEAIYSSETSRTPYSSQSLPSQPQIEQGFCLHIRLPLQNRKHRVTITETSCLGT